jgi:signal transduction histidine kinase
VTEERRAAEALARHVSDLNVINDELESFSYSVSHDLRAPLRHIVGFAALLQEAANDRMLEEDRRYVQTIVKSATHMGRLIDDLLSFSRMSRAVLDRRPVNLDALIDEIVSEVGREAGKEIAWKIHPLPYVHGDRAMLRQVFVNLLSNAVKYTPRGGSVALTLDSAADSAVLSVADTGIGIPEEDQTALFTRFFRASNAVEAAIPGSGLGLSIVRTIVANHRGEMSIKSGRDQGTTVIVRIPLDNGAVATLAG